MQVYSVQVLDEYDKGYLGDIVEGIYWAIENNMDIINLSFGTTYNAEILHQAIRNAKNAGIFSWQLQVTVEALRQCILQHLTK